jgi:hypothetical protein
LGSTRKANTRLACKLRGDYLKPGDRPFSVAAQFHPWDVAISTRHDADHGIGFSRHPHAFGGGCAAERGNVSMAIGRLSKRSTVSRTLSR